MIKQWQTFICNLNIYTRYMCKKLFTLNNAIERFELYIYICISYLLENFVLIKMANLIKCQVKLSNSKKKRKK